ncbi:hypothetical protein GYMLUDRAFT_241811 [Collybiopsis luxurians FD-317 M1]|uniref:Uncharacterized protein n=1 Tax=Collybiopsis luxurians FD-317 M1 TaxID=944289 RepID=A0A0D0BH49_9AGAR|nr:hypothetical protein GYMLUDRAFT_241811 [Collybiopsis luxurians FD-317 M1]
MVSSNEGGGGGGGDGRVVDQMVYRMLTVGSGSPIPLLSLSLDSNDGVDDVNVDWDIGGAMRRRALESLVELIRATSWEEQVHKVCGWWNVKQEKRFGRKTDCVWHGDGTEKARSPKPLRSRTRWQIAARVYAQLVIRRCRTEESIDENQPRLLHWSEKIFSSSLYSSTSSRRRKCFSNASSGQNILHASYLPFMITDALPSRAKLTNPTLTPDQLGLAFFIGRPRAIVLQLPDTLEYKLVHIPLPEYQTPRTTGRQTLSLPLRVRTKVGTRVHLVSSNLGTSFR